MKFGTLMDTQIIKKMRKPLLYFAFAFVAFISLDSCYYDKGDVLNGNVCDTSNVNYENQISAIIDLNCIHCHNSAKADGGVILETYEQVRDITVNGNLIPCINHESGYPRMPADKNEKMDPCFLSQFDIWLEIGTPKN